MEARDIQTEFVGPIGKDDGKSKKTQTLVKILNFSGLFYLHSTVDQFQEITKMKLCDFNPEVYPSVRPKYKYEPE